MMLMRIVMQLSGRSMALFTQALAWLKALPCKLVKLLPASFIRVYQNAVNRRLLVVLTEQNTNLWRVNLITVVQLIKAGLITVRAKVIQIGLQLQTTVRQISQRVLIVLLQTKDKLVELIKLAQSHLNANKIAQIPMVAQLIQVGLKYLEAAKQLLQRAINLLKKDK